MYPWTTYTPGQQAECPSCGRRLGFVGLGYLYRLRISPLGKRARPSIGVALAEACKWCGINLERELIRLPRAS